jgi:hypothetical protein
MRLARPKERKINKRKEKGSTPTTQRVTVAHRIAQSPGGSLAEFALTIHELQPPSSSNQGG